MENVAKAVKEYIINILKSERLSGITQPEALVLPELIRFIEKYYR